MLSKRIIACLDVRDGQVVKGVNFEGLRTAGDPAELARRYNAEGVDELVILDITATLERRRALADTIRAVAKELFIPLAVGGGIHTEADAAAAVDAGADKVSLNTAALADPSLITTLAGRYGSQAVLVAIDAKRNRGGFAVYARSGQAPADRDAVEWAREAGDHDVFRWVRRFERFSKVQVIDLDAAMGTGDNLAIVRQVAAALSCRVGGGIRSIERAQDVLAAGAQQIIAGSALFKDGRPDLEFAKRLSDAIGMDRVIAAVDSR